MPTFPDSEIPDLSSLCDRSSYLKYLGINSDDIDANHIFHLKSKFKDEEESPLQIGILMCPNCVL